MTGSRAQHTLVAHPIGRHPPRLLCWAGDVALQFTEQLMQHELTTHHPTYKVPNHSCRDYLDEIPFTGKQL